MKSMIWALLAMLIMIPLLVFAQGEVPKGSELLDFLKPLADMYAFKSGFVSGVIVWMGSFRLLFKPAMEALQFYADKTPSTKDNEFLDKMKASSAYKWVSFGIDWIASIKLPK